MSQPPRFAAVASQPVRSGGVFGPHRIIFGKDANRFATPFDHILVDDDLTYPVELRQLEHRIEQDRLDNRAQSARTRLALDRLAADRAQRILGEIQPDIFELEQLAELLCQRVLGFGQNLHQRCFVEVLKRGDNGQAADKFRDQAEFEQILWLDILEHFAGAAFIGINDMCAEPD